jgi:hypothetical protein
MSRTFHHGERRIRIRRIRKDPPDLRRLARALIELAQLEAEVEAQAESEKRSRPSRLKRSPEKSPPEAKTRQGDAA